MIANQMGRVIIGTKGEELLDDVDVELARVQCLDNEK